MFIHTSIHSKTPTASLTPLDTLSHDMSINMHSSACISCTSKPTTYLRSDRTLESWETTCSGDHRTLAQPLILVLQSLVFAPDFCVSLFQVIHLLVLPLLVVLDELVLLCQRVFPVQT